MVDVWDNIFNNIFIIIVTIIIEIPKFPTYLSVVFNKNAKNCFNKL